jgi:hypothetical protein
MGSSSSPANSAASSARTATIATWAILGPDAGASGSFAEFHPCYLGAHSNRICRRLHVVGSSLASLHLGWAVFRVRPIGLLYGLLCGYAFAWLGQFGFENNKPASFKRPLCSFLGDWAMFRDIVLRRIPS